MTTAVTVIFLIIMNAVYRKINKLPLTTIIPVWLFVILIPGLTFNVIVTNLERIEKPKSADPYIAYLLLQYCLLPVAILFIIHLFNKQGILYKGAAIFGGTIALMLIERIIAFAGLFQYIRWTLGHSALLWLFIIISSIAFFVFVESKFIRGDSIRYG